MDENEKYGIIKKLVETDGNKKTAALKIGCTERHVNRMIKGYKEKGKEFFVHGNRGKQPATSFPPDIKQSIIDLYRNKYYECNLTHYRELLQKEEVSLQTSILGLENAHPRRPRCARFGEMLQMDASEHPWFGGLVTHLHITVDDATGMLLGAYFDKQETLNGYYHVLHQVILSYGIPYQFLTDRRTIFEYKNKGDNAVDKDTFTQFGYACKQLGIDIRTSGVAQTKGRVERMFGTLQSRLPIELRLAGVSSIEEANKFLNSYIKEFNKQFALPFDNITSVFEKQPGVEKINLILAVLSPRKFDNGSCLKYQKEYYLPVDSRGMAVYFRKGTSAMVIKAFNGELYCCIDEHVYALERLPVHNSYSKAFDLAVIPDPPKKKYIPPMSHPWKQDSFEKYVKKQSHRIVFA